MKVSSLFLWQQVLRDRRVNSPFQRFKRHILLLLQIMLLLLLVFAALEPFFYGNLSKNVRIPILIDNSASMGAKDESGKTRLEKAKEKVRKMVDDKVSGQEFCLITFSNSARKVCGFTDNSRILLDALDKIQVEEVAGNIEDALRMAQAIARNFPFDEAILLSDGNFPEQADFNLSYQLNFQKIPKAGANLGITALTAQKTAGGDWQVFTELSGTNTAGPAEVELYLNGKKFATDTFSPTPGQEERIGFTVSGQNQGVLEIKLNPNSFDALTADNQAWLRLPKIRPLWIYISPSLKSINAALRGIGGISIASGDINAEAADFDLIITDQSANFAKDSRVLFSTGIVPQGVSSLVKITQHNVEVVDWNREEPLLRHVELGELTILEGGVPVQGQVASLEKDLADLGYETLVFAKDGPLLLKRNWGGRLEYNLMFHPDRSTLPFRIGFPILFKNLIEITREKVGLADLQADQTGILPGLKLAPDTQYKVLGPDGESNEIISDKYGLLNGVNAGKTGKYIISSTSGKETIEVGASLLDRKESSLQGIDKISFNELAVTAEQQTVKSAKSLWKIIALLALVMLMIEWWFFNRKPGGNISYQSS